MTSKSKYFIAILYIKLRLRNTTVGYFNVATLGDSKSAIDQKTWIQDVKLEREGDLLRTWLSHNPSAKCLQSLNASAFSDKWPSLQKCAFISFRQK